MKFTDQAGKEVEVLALSAESWSLATSYSKLLGAVPPTFSSSVRTIRTAVERAANKDSITLDSGQQSAILRLIKSPSLSTALYYGATCVREVQGDPNALRDPKLLLSILGPDLLSCMLGLLYCYRRSKRVKESDLWEELSIELHARMELGLAIGNAIPKIGPGVGLIVGGIRQIALSLIFIRDEKNFKLYRRMLKKEKKNFILEHEHQTWGCTHLQIATKLLQACGFGLNYASALSFGLSPETPAEMINNDESFYRWSITQKWLDALLETGDEPKMTHRGNYYPLKEDLTRMRNIADKVRDIGPSVRWMDKEAEDVPVSNEAATATNTPQDGIAENELGI